MANFDDLQGAVAQFGANNKVIFDDTGMPIHIGYGVLLLFAFALTFLYPSFCNRADNLHRCRVGYSCFIHAR